MVDFTPSAPTTGTQSGTSGVSFTPSYDQSMATLARSQKLSDMQMEADRAKQQADAMATPTAIAGETAKGTASELFDKTLKFAQSAVHAPMDIVRGLMGKPADTTVHPNFAGEGQKTIQGDISSGGGLGRAAMDFAEGLPIPAGATEQGAMLAEKSLIKPVTSLAKGVLEKTGITKFLADRAAQKESSLAVNSLDNQLTGKKLTEAYKAVGTGDRTAKPQTLFGEQQLNPDEQTLRLATRLKDTLTGKTPLENLNNAAKEFDTTEKQINDLLNSGDPQVVYNAQKPALMTSLESARASIPQEYAAIKDSKKVYDSVISYAQRVVQGAPDTPAGIRVARQTFDNQAKREFPSAYKNGSIDLKTPAGRAIKAARDTMNEHFYATAPEGSKIKDLVLHEADLYRAIEKIAPNASQGEGQSAVKALIAKHPAIATLLTAALGGTIGAEIKSNL